MTNNGTTPRPVATLATLHLRLAQDRVRRYPVAYHLGRFEDALYFARHQYRTKAAAVLACEVFGLPTGIQVVI